MRHDDVFKTDLIYFWHTHTEGPFADQHCHDEYEIFYFIQGDIEYRIEDREYLLNDNSLLLIPSQAFHGLKALSDRPCHRVSIHFLPEFLDEDERALLPILFNADRHYYPDITPFNIDFYISSVLGCKEVEKGFQQAAMRSRVVSLMTQIASMISRSGQPADQAGGASHQLIQDILCYLNANLREPISLDTTAAKYHISKNYLNTVFRRETGTTVGQYIRIKRLALARKEIREGRSAKEAAFAVGFNDYSNFFKAYKAFFGLPPSAPAIDEVDPSLG
jgi:AraC-like DNA-binding protein/mannose-6-phosphate isomerase-like protein (cupin superfamily)